MGTQPPKGKSNISEPNRVRLEYASRSNLHYSRIFLQPNDFLCALLHCKITLPYINCVTHAPRSVTVNSLPPQVARWRQGWHLSGTPRGLFILCQSPAKSKHHHSLTAGISRRESAGFRIRRLALLVAIPPGCWTRLVGHTRNGRALDSSAAP
jgi:hypothetical protein